MRVLEMIKNFEESKISPKEIFDSASVLGCLRATAKVVSQRYAVPLLVTTQYNLKNTFVASTNNTGIQINTGNILTNNIYLSSGLNAATLSLVGLLGHELGHVLFTDFSLMMNCQVKCATSCRKT